MSGCRSGRAPCVEPPARQGSGRRSWAETANVTESAWCLADDAQLVPTPTPTPPTHDRWQTCTSSAWNRRPHTAPRPPTWCDAWPGCSIPRRRRAAAAARQRARPASLLGHETGGALQPRLESLLRPVHVPCTLLLTWLMRSFPAIRFLLAPALSLSFAPQTSLPCPLGAASARLTWRAGDAASAAGQNTRADLSVQVQRRGLVGMHVRRGVGAWVAPS